MFWIFNKKTNTYFSQIVVMISTQITYSIIDLLVFTGIMKLSKWKWFCLFDIRFVDDFWHGLKAMHSIYIEKYIFFSNLIYKKVNIIFRLYNRKAFRWIYFWRNLLCKNHGHYLSKSGRLWWFLRAKIHKKDLQTQKFIITWHKVAICGF